MYCRQDGDFSEKQFRVIINACLANDIGNLLNRTLNLLKKNCDSVITVSASDISQDSPLRALVSLKVETSCHSESVIVAFAQLYHN